MLILLVTDASSRGGLNQRPLLRNAQMEQAASTIPKLPAVTPFLGIERVSRVQGGVGPPNVIFKLGE